MPLQDSPKHFEAVDMLTGLAVCLAGSFYKRRLQVDAVPRIPPPTLSLTARRHGKAGKGARQVRAEVPAEGYFGNVADEALLVRAAQFDSASFAPLYQHDYPRVYRYLRARCNSDEDAADLTQAVFLRALAALPDYRERGLTIERHWRELPGGMERMTISGGYDRRPMQALAAQRGGLTVATGFLAGGDVAWTSEETNGWPIRAIWDNGRYRIELTIGNVASRKQWNEDDLIAIVYALASQEQD